MDVNTACSEISSEYNLFMFKPETLHYLHVWPAFSAIQLSVSWALKCAFLPCKRMVLHIPGILPLKTNVHLSYLIDYCITEYKFLYKFLEINLGKNSGLLWSLQCYRVCGWYYSSSLYDCSCAFFPMGKNMVCLYKRRLTPKSPSLEVCGGGPGRVRLKVGLDLRSLFQP